MDGGLLIVLIPALPLAGFLFAVFVGPRFDHVPSHGHDDHGDESHGESHDDHDDHDDHDVDDSAFRTIPSEEEQAATSPHAGHADDLANAEGAAGVIPADLDDGLGQSGHVAPGAERPRYRSWIVPTVLVGLMWAISMLVFVDVIFGGNQYEVTVYRWIASGDFDITISFLVDSLTAMLLLVVSTVGSLIHLYSIGYMDGGPSFPRFFTYLNLFMFAMLLLVLANNFLLMFRRVGRGRPLLLPADRLLVREAVGGAGGEEGLPRQPGRRLRLHPRRGMIFTFGTLAYSPPTGRSSPEIAGPSTR